MLIATVRDSYSALPRTTEACEARHDGYQFVVKIIINGQ